MPQQFVVLRVAQPRCHMNPVKLDIHAQAEQRPMSSERAAQGQDSERYLGIWRIWSRLDTVGVAQTIQGNSAFHVGSYRGLEKTILDGYGEFPAVANGGYAGCSLNRVTIFFIDYDVASRGDGEGLLIEALVHRPKFDTESQREPDIHYRTDGIALRLCRKFTVTRVVSQHVGERYADLNSNGDVLRECARRSSRKKTG